LPLFQGHPWKYPCRIQPGLTGRDDFHVLDQIPRFPDSLIASGKINVGRLRSRPYLAKKAMNAKTKEPQVAIVTGASSGIGLGITRALLERGFRVVANSRTVTKSKDLKSSANLVLIEGDIGNKETAVELAEAAIKHFGRIDLLVNNAGIYMPKPFTEYTPEDFEIMIHTNVAGYFFVTQQAVAQMRKQKSGHIVSIAAAVVDQPLAGAPISLPVITKSTIPAFSRELAMEFVADGIRANTISPGTVDTPMHANDDHEVLKKLSPAGRLVQISQIVDAVLYLQSAPTVNGENIRIGGGAHAGAKW
jgi:NAD(P)-dependent dehydrogenase (short-subunit alcohol dehydrogenase family)